ncbi:MAG: glycosyltransferase [Balneolaceae bacterium]
MSRQGAETELQKLLILSTPVGPLGSGLGGGVERTINSLVAGFRERAWEIDVVAPAGSTLAAEGAHLIQAEGSLQPPAQRASNGVESSVLKSLCRYAKERQAEYDLILNFAYDELPYRLTVELQTPLVHFVSMSSIHPEMDRAITRTGKLFPGRLACYSYRQAQTFPSPEAFQVLGAGIDSSLYTFRSRPREYFVWAGRISPEKGLEDAVEASALCGCRLLVLGKMENLAYWNRVMEQYPGTKPKYGGYHDTRHFQELLGWARALLMTPRWVEAFGLVTLEALACGVPVISYNRGGPSGIVKDGKTGYLTEPDRPDKLAGAMNRIDSIDRAFCRQDLEERFSRIEWCNLMEGWFNSITRRERAL